MEQVINNSAVLTGSRDFSVLRGGGRGPSPVSPERLRDQLRRNALPNTGNREIDAYRLRNTPNLLRGLMSIMIAKAVGAPTFFGVVSQKVLRNCTFDRFGRVVDAAEVLDYGIVSCRVVTTAGVGFIVDAFQNSVEVENMKYHGYGTGSTAEASGDTALVTELTTQYATNNTRPTGTTTEGASANIFRTVATLSPDANVTITEHGIFDQASNAGGTLLDRSVFTGIALVGSSDSLQTTYDLTLTAGS